MTNSLNKTTINFWLLIILFAIILGAAGVSIVYTLRANSLAKANVSTTKEATLPANLEAIVINDKNCQDCFDVTPILTNLANANVKLTAQRTIDKTNSEAQALIAQYSITKLPTVILRGEIQKDTNLKSALTQAGDINNDTFVLRQIGGPYVLVATGEIKGRTALTLIADASCAKCYDVKSHQLILAGFGLTPKVTNLDVSAAQAKTLISKYKITLVPTFILTGEVKEYPTLLNVWSQVGAINKDGAYIFTTGVPTMGIYKNLKTKKIIDPSQSASTTNATSTAK